MLIIHDQFSFGVNLPARFFPFSVVGDAQNAWKKIYWHNTCAVGNTVFSGAEFVNNISLSVALFLSCSASLFERLKSESFEELNWGKITPIFRFFRFFPVKILSSKVFFSAYQSWRKPSLLCAHAWTKSKIVFEKWTFKDLSYTSGLNGEEDLHKERLKAFCQRCGDPFDQNLNNRHNPQPATKFTKEILQIDNLDITSDNEYTHPPFLCRRCVAKIQRFKKGKNKNQPKFPGDQGKYFVFNTHTVKTS